jgi:opacity protein-like surface antigen
MKNLVLGSVALIAIGVSVSAHAADMAVKAPPPAAAAAPYNWSGLYVGGNFGGARVNCDQIQVETGLADRPQTRPIANEGAAGSRLPRS